MVWLMAELDRHSGYIISVHVVLLVCRNMFT